MERKPCGIRGTSVGSVSIDVTGSCSSLCVIQRNLRRTYFRQSSSPTWTPLLIRLRYLSPLTIVVVGNYSEGIL